MYLLSLCIQLRLNLELMSSREFKAGQFAVALDKYQKALRYLDVHPVLPYDSPESLVESYRAM